MPYLIDGYNLLHAMGVLQGRAGPKGLEKARLCLLGMLRGAYQEKASEVTVAFDAANAPPGSKGELDYQGIHVHFAVHDPQADDLIERFIQRDSAPHQLTVVSDDHRIQQAARRRQCHVLGCLDYLEELDRRRRRRQTPSEALEKKETLSQEEMQQWLAEFADMENDPAFKEFFHPYDFKESDFSN